MILCYITVQNIKFIMRSESKHFYYLSIKYETLHKEKKVQALEAQNQLREQLEIAADD